MKMNRPVALLAAAVLLLSILAGCGTAFPMSFGDVWNTREALSEYIHGSIQALAELGIDATAQEDALTERLVDFLEEPGTSTEKGLILGFVLTSVYDLEASSDILYWDTEVFEIETMYADFLEAVDALSGGELEITDVFEDNSGVDWEKDAGKKSVSFTLLGESCSYSAPFQGDWMNEGIVDCLNDTLEKAGAEKRLLLCSDGYQGIILFYNTPEWCEHYNEKFPELPLSASSSGDKWSLGNLVR